MTILHDSPGTTQVQKISFLSFKYVPLPFAKDSCREYTNFLKSYKPLPLSFSLKKT
jgi:hypothetical protein